MFNWDETHETYLIKIWRKEEKREQSKEEDDEQ